MCNKNKRKTHLEDENSMIVINHGYILKEASMPKVYNQNLTHRGYLLRSIFEIYKPLYEVGELCKVFEPGTI